MARLAVPRRKRKGRRAEHESSPDSLYLVGPNQCAVGNLMQLTGRNLSTGAAFPVEVRSHQAGLTLSGITIVADPSSPTAIVKLRVLSRLADETLSDPVELSAELQVHILDSLSGKSVYPRFYDDWALDSWAELPDELQVRTPMSAVYFAAPLAMSVVISVS
jgi:hypothetical protein